jgi:hypothetical protein
MASSHTPLRYDLEVGANGRLEVAVPLPVGSHVTVFIVEKSTEDFTDLVAAAESSTSFWDHPFDDEDWNAA